MSHDACVVVGEERIDLIERTFNLFGVAHHGRLLFQLLLFASNEVSLGELAVLEAQEVGSLSSSGERLLHLFTVGLHLLIAGITRLERKQSVFAPGDDIHHLHLEVGSAEEQVLMLRVDVEELATQLLQCAECHRRVVDECATTGCRGKFAAQDTLLIVVV